MATTKNELYLFKGSKTYTHTQRYAKRNCIGAATPKIFTIWVFTKKKKKNSPPLVYKELPVSSLPRPWTAEAILQRQSTDRKEGAYIRQHKLSLQEKKHVLYIMIRDIT